MYIQNLVKARRPRKSELEEEYYEVYGKYPSAGTIELEQYLAGKKERVAPHRMFSRIEKHDA